MTDTTNTIVIDSFHEDDSYLNEFDKVDAIIFGSGILTILGVVLSFILSVLA